MNAPGLISPVPASSTSLIDQGNALAQQGYQAPTPMMPQAQAGGGFGAAMSNPLTGLAVASYGKSVQSGANLMGLVGKNPMHRGLDASMAPGQAFQQQQDYTAAVAENTAGMIPGANLLGLDKIAGSMAKMFTRGKAMRRAAELADAQRDIDRKYMEDQREFSGYGQTYNDIF